MTSYIVHHLGGFRSELKDDLIIRVEQSGKTVSFFNSNNCLVYSLPLSRLWYVERMRA